MSLLFFFKQKTAYELRSSDWSSDVCSSDLAYLRYNVADPVRLELLRKRSLLLDILPLAVAKGAVDVGGAAGRDRPNFREVAARLMAEIGSASCRARVCPYV